MIQIEANPLIAIGQEVSGPQWDAYVAEREAEAGGGQIRHLYMDKDWPIGKVCGPHNFEFLPSSKWQAPFVLIRRLTIEEYITRTGEPPLPQYPFLYLVRLLG